MSQKQVLAALDTEQGVKMTLSHLKRLYRIWELSKKNITIKRKKYVRDVLKKRQDEGKTQHRVRHKKSDQDVDDAVLQDILAISPRHFEGVGSSPGDIEILTPDAGSMALPDNVVRVDTHDQSIAVNAGGAGHNNGAIPLGLDAAVVDSAVDFQPQPAENDLHGEFEGPFASGPVDRSSEVPSTSTHDDNNRQAIDFSKDQTGQCCERTQQSHYHLQNPVTCTDDELGAIITAGVEGIPASPGSVSVGTVSPASESQQLDLEKYSHQYEENFERWIAGWKNEATSYFSYMMNPDIGQEDVIGTDAATIMRDVFEPGGIDLHLDPVYWSIEGGRPSYSARESSGETALDVTVASTVAFLERHFFELKPYIDRLPEKGRAVSYIPILVHLPKIQKEYGASHFFTVAATYFLLGLIYKSCVRGFEHQFFAI
ncbi:hypothetical protein TWF696_008003 [Orbilia brochopaga]|uniref:Uncharacterized protein n=1 Tax=Orbilia brochopaga TaxID=3140254 RepID=A0AAV9UMY4_9PEZI